MAISRSLANILTFRGVLAVDLSTAVSDDLELRVSLEDGEDESDPVFGIGVINPHVIRLSGNDATQIAFKTLENTARLTIEQFLARRTYVRARGPLPFALFAAEQGYPISRAEGVRELWRAESDAVRLSYADRLGKTFLWLDEAP